MILGLFDFSRLVLDGFCGGKLNHFCLRARLFAVGPFLTAVPVLSAAGSVDR